MTNNCFLLHCRTQRLIMGKHNVVSCVKNNLLPMRFDEYRNTFADACVRTNAAQAVCFEWWVVPVCQPVALNMKVLPHPLRPVRKSAKIRKLSSVMVGRVWTRLNSDYDKIILWFYTGNYWFGLPPAMLWAAVSEEWPPRNPQSRFSSRKCRSSR